MYSKEDFEKIKNIILNEVKDVEEIYLFGSYSKGNANAESDIDIAIIVTKKWNWKIRKNILNKIYRKTAKNNLDVDFILKDKLSFENDCNLPTIASEIKDSGKILWKRR